MPSDEPRAMREIHEIRVRLTQKLATLTPEERLRYYADRAAPLRRIFAERAAAARNAARASSA